MICPSCGKTAKEGTTLCPSCGAPITDFQDTATQYREKLQKGVEGKLDPGVTMRHKRVQQPPTGRRSGSDRPVAPQPTRRSAGSRPETQPIPRTEQAVRMVKRHQYEAIAPEQTGYERFNWVRVFVITAALVFLLTTGSYAFLRYSPLGQTVLASIGREASSTAYHDLGRQYLAQGSVGRAASALEIAQGKDPNNLEILVDLGRAYQALDEQAMAELAYTRAIQYWQEYPDPYRLLVDMMLEQTRNYEAVKLAEIAYNQTNDDYFNTLLRVLTPTTPTASRLGGRSNSEFELTLTCQEGCRIFYTVLGEDPLAVGVLYTEPLYLEEGTWHVRAVSEKNGIYSRTLVQNYVINKPVPDAPSANLASGTYASVRTVGLRAGKDAVAIYYTTDGTAPSLNGKLYENPVQLRIGNTTVRAIAVNAEGKVSNEMNIVYKCEGRTQTSMNEKDTVDKLKLYETTQDAFIKTYGTPQGETADGEDAIGVYTRLTYSFGYATFVDRKNNQAPVLMELSTRSSSFSGPRGTRVGMRVEEIITAFRDVGGEFASDGNRLLYIVRTEKTNSQAFYRKLDENRVQISYYFQLENKQMIELSYFATDGLVDRMEWLRYIL